MKSYKLVILLLVLVGAGFARDWRTGKLVSFDESWVPTVASTDQMYYSLVSGDGVSYYAQRELKAFWNHKPKFTENSDVRFCIEGHHMLLIDDDGKQFKMDLVKKRKD